MATAQETARTCRVPFVLRGIQARSVVVTGDFTGWATDRVRLKCVADGEWSGVLEIPPGEHQYRLLVDGEWRDHDAAATRIANPFGSENCVLRVP